MNLIAGCVANPVKTAVGVLLVALFGTLALLTMPVQLTAEVQVPTLTVEARWLGGARIHRGHRHGRGARTGQYEAATDP